MARGLLFAIAIGVGWLLPSPFDGWTPADAGEDNEPMIVHNVYFSLADASETARGNFVKACEKYLRDHPGLVYFAAGPRGPEFKRTVNDQEFDVALHLVFKDKAAHDTYQTSEKDQQFVAEYSPTLKKIRVFDSKVTNSKMSN
jgi:hypothetical protein